MVTAAGVTAYAAAEGTAPQGGGPVDGGGGVVGRPPAATAPTVEIAVTGGGRALGGGVAQRLGRVGGVARGGGGRGVEVVLRSDVGGARGAAPGGDRGAHG